MLPAKHCVAFWKSCVWRACTADPSDRCLHECTCANPSTACSLGVHAAATNPGDRPAAALGAAVRSAGGVVAAVVVVEGGDLSAVVRQQHAGQKQVRIGAIACQHHLSVTSGQPRCCCALIQCCCTSAAHHAAAAVVVILMPVLPMPAGLQRHTDCGHTSPNRLICCRRLLQGPEFHLSEPGCTPGSHIVACAKDT